MTGLSAYLARVFTRDTLAIFATSLVLLYLVQCLRIFDVVSVQGQNLGTLLGQALLGMPPLAVVFGYLCVGIGMARGFASLQARQELHVIHSNARLPALLGGAAIFIGGCTLVVLVVANFVAPFAASRLDDWSASVAADLVGRTLTPHRFTEVVPHVAIVIGGRHGAGQINNFFADDTRDPKMEHTYISKTAVVAKNGDGYVLELRDGSIQYLSSDGEFSRVSFRRYNIDVSSLTKPLGRGGRLADLNTVQLLRRGLGTGTWSAAMVETLTGRLAEGLKIIATCLFVLAIAAFPNARRTRFEMPRELLVLLVAFLQGAIGNYAPGPPQIALTIGPLLVLVASAIALVWRMRIFAPYRQGAQMA